jgi:F0F1-type ATP synthase assembly protein I
VVGYFIGNWLDGKLHTAPYLMILFSLLGLVAAGRETIKLLKMAADDEEKPDDNLQG